MDVGNELLELRLGAMGREVGDLRLEGDDEVAGGVDDGGAEVEDAARVAAHGEWKTRRVGIQADAEQRAMGLFGPPELLGEPHAPGRARASRSASPV